MPWYEYACPNGHHQTRFLLVANHTAHVSCDCGDLATQIIGSPLLVKAAPNVCYDSPIDGTPITSWDARREDLKRNGCREYDPGMKVDYNNRIKESEAALDKTIDAHVEEAIEKMPTAKRGKLYSELTDQGVNADVMRTTPTS